MHKFQPATFIFLELIAKLLLINLAYSQSTFSYSYYRFQLPIVLSIELQDCVHDATNLLLKPPNPDCCLINFRFVLQLLFFHYLLYFSFIDLIVRNHISFNSFSLKVLFFLLKLPLPYLPFTRNPKEAFWFLIFQFLTEKRETYFIFQFRVAYSRFHSTLNSINLGFLFLENRFETKEIELWTQVLRLLIHAS